MINDESVKGGIDGVDHVQYCWFCRIPSINVT